jgi:hypothetical protein
MRGSGETETDDAVGVYVLHFRALGVPVFGASWTGLDHTESVNPDIADGEAFYEVDGLSEGNGKLRAEDAYLKLL